MSKSVWAKMAAAAAVLSLGLTACVQSERDPEGGAGDDTFVFAASSDPVMLDPAMASDGESFRIAHQVFEGLVGVEPGTLELTPRLATEWEASEDGKEFTFTLREGVKFHDGTDFDSDAVCANFERWANWKGLNQNENITYYYGKLFQGYKNPENGGKPGIYDSCDAASPTEVTIKLNKPFAGFVDAMVLPAFAMQSPTAMEEHNADDTQGTEDDPRFSEYATEHPTGTGPFKFNSWERGQQITLDRNEEYWGDKAKVSQAIIRVIEDPNARTQELQAGNIDGYDLVAPADLQPLKDEGMQVMERPPYTILYIAFNQKNKALQDERVRKALNHAIDKDAVISQSLPEGTEKATQFMPSSVDGYADDVTEYEYDPEKAKKLLKEAGQENLKLRFAYPTGVSRPYMPTPEDTYVAIKAQLEAVGITVEPVTAKWSPDYLDMAQGSDGVDKRDIHMLGWSGDYNDTDNFVGVFFGKKSNEWGFDNPELFKELAAAREIGTKEEQAEKYEEINRQIAEYAPGIPVAHPAASLAFAPGVEGFTPSPINDEVWNTISVSR